MLIERRHTGAQRTGGVETAGECHIKISLFCAKAGVFDIHYSCAPAQDEMCVVERIIVSVCVILTL